jgi:DNA-binding transcriptional LysR family regulator
VARPSFSLEQVRSFVAVSEHEHISKAAASLFLTQGAVTQQVRHFERAIGLQLIERDGRGIRLTDAGRTMAVACRAALRSVQVLEDTAESMKTLKTGSLHLGASPTCASYYLPSRLAGFIHDHPGVSLSMVVESSAEINQQVIVGTLDCGMIEGEPDPQLLAVVLDHDELILVAHRDHPLTMLPRVTPADLAQHRYIGRVPSWAAERSVRAILGEVYDHTDSLNLAHPEYVRAAVLAGLGYAAMPRLAVESDLESGSLKRLPGPSSRRPIRAIRRHATGGPALEQFWQLLAGKQYEAAVVSEAQRS